MRNYRFEVFDLLGRNESARPCALALIRSKEKLNMVAFCQIKKKAATPASGGHAANPSSLSGAASLITGDVEARDSIQQIFQKISKSVFDKNNGGLILTPVRHKDLQAHTSSKYNQPNCSVVLRHLTGKMLDIVFGEETKVFVPSTKGDRHIVKLGLLVDQKAAYLAGVLIAKALHNRLKLPLALEPGLVGFLADPSADSASKYFFKTYKDEMSSFKAAVFDLNSTDAAAKAASVKSVRNFLKVAGLFLKEASDRAPFDQNIWVGLKTIYDSGSDESTKDLVSGVFMQIDRAVREIFQGALRNLEKGFSSVLEWGS